MAERNLRSLATLLIFPLCTWAQALSPEPVRTPVADPATKLETTEDWNRRISQLARSISTLSGPATATDIVRIGPDDLLAITVLEEPDLNRQLRVSSSGEISMPLLGQVKATGLTPQELEMVLQERLRATYMKDPHVGVMISELQSRSVSVMGAVKKPGVFQVMGIKTLLEMLSMAQGLADNAGDTVYVTRGRASATNASAVEQEAGADHGPDNTPAIRARSFEAASSQLGRPSGGESLEVNLKKLLNSTDSESNVFIYPGDIVTVKAAGIVYVVGEVRRPGGFPLQNNDSVTVLQALALGEGLMPTARKSGAMIIRTAEDGKRTEVPVNLAKILKGKAPDVLLHAKDVLFVPGSAGKNAAAGMLRTLSGWVIFRGPNI